MPTPAVAALVRQGIEHQLHRYDHDPSNASYGQEAADALAVERGRVFKTLVVEAGAELVVAVVPVTTELDLKSLAGSLGAKRAELADPTVAQRATGYVLGGISPFGQRRRHRTVVDITASSWITVFVSGGRRGLEIELAPADLVRATSGRLAPIAAAP